MNEVKIAKSCKGFWNMCACDACRKKDRSLEKAMEKNPGLTHHIAGALVKGVKP